MKNNTSIVTVAVAIVFAIVATTSAAQLAGDAFSFGSNSGGQLGLNTTEQYPTDVAVPIVTTYLDGRKIVQVDAGVGHSLLLADDGSVFSFGINSATGLGTTSGNTIVATPIDTTNLGGRKITQVAAGSYSSLILAEDGSVFAFGLNSYGQLGTNDNVPRSVATPIDAVNLGGRKITQVAASNAHSLLLADDGTVFSFGNNFWGQLGLGTTGPTTGVPAPTPIVTTNLGGRKITQVAAGNTHSLLLADDGAVFSIGSNLEGATGLGTPAGSFTRTTVATPILTTNLGGRKITQVAAGGDLSLLLAEDGSVFSFGQNDTGQLGLGTEDNHVSVATPINTTNLGSLKITQIAAGHSYSLILAENGNVFAFGANHNHELGVVGPQQLLVATPIDTTNLGGRTVTQISAGDQHSLLIAELPGDFNHDGIVDAADYVVWRKGIGIAPTQENYNLWRSNFGRTAGSVAGAESTNGAVPEPATMSLLSLATLSTCAWLRRKNCIDVRRA
jgi:alpha-tubulin suppressor-like RCC1 family protein